MTDFKINYIKPVQTTRNLVALAGVQVGPIELTIRIEEDHKTRKIVCRTARFRVGDADFVMSYVIPDEMWRDMTRRIIREYTDEYM